MFLSHSHPPDCLWIELEQQTKGGQNQIIKDYKE